jgi:olfactory receptor
VMAYDYFTAICHRLQYIVIMSHRVCAIMIVGTWMGNCGHAFVLTFLTLSYPTVAQLRWTIFSVIFR